MRNRYWNFSLSAALLLMCPFDLIAALGMDMYLPAIPGMPKLLGTTSDRVQLTLSAYLVVLGAGQLIFGPLSDRVGRRPVLLGGALLFTLSSLALAWTRSLPLFLLFRIVQAIGAAATLLATFATVRDVYAERKEGTMIYGSMGAILAFVPAVGPLLGAIGYELGGLRAVFVTLAALSLIAGLRAAHLWPETRPADSHRIRAAHFGEVLRHGRFWTYTLGYAVAMGSFFVYLSTAPGVLVDRYGFSPLGFSAMFATVALVLIAASRLTPRLVGRYGLAGCLVRGMALILVGAVLEVVHETAAPSVFGFMVPIWILGVGIAMTVGTAANGALAPFPKIAGTATALFSCAGSVLLVSFGTIATVALPGRTAWPLIAFAGVGASIVLLHARGTRSLSGT